VTPERLVEIEARCAAATPGEWTHNLDLDPPDAGIEGPGGGTVCHVQEHGNVNTVAWAGEAFRHADARFIAHARQDVPDLLAEVKRLRRGDFTPEEFQALCHHWEERAVSREEFEAGCREYQAKRFGGAT
jgi:hypothetical protein